MTCGELRQAVLHLGFAEGFDDSVLDAAFPDAATRALIEVSRLRPRQKQITVTHSPILPICDPLDLRHEDGDVTVSQSGVASFCFYISGGSARLTVRLGNQVRELSVNGAARTFVSYTVRDLFSVSTVKNDIELTFSGDYFYCISELSFYSLLRSDGAIAPPSAGSVYDMRELVPDFARFYSPPEHKGGLLVFDYRIEGPLLILEADAPEGDYTLVYEQMPAPVTVDTEDGAELDCDRETCDMVPLITAYYVWLDDYPDKAMAFYQRYSEQAALLREKRRVREPRRFVSTNGW